MNDSHDFRDDVDLRDMDGEAAREYVLRFIGSLKETRKQKEKYLEDLRLWQERVRTAQNAGRSDLLEAAERRVADLNEQVAGLTAEEEELASKVRRLKENLKTAQHGFQRSIDADLLLANLQMLVGEENGVEETFRDQEADLELEELKKKLRDEPG